MIFFFNIKQLARFLLYSINHAKNFSQKTPTFSLTFLPKYVIIIPNVLITSPNIKFTIHLFYRQIKLFARPVDFDILLKFSMVHDNISNAKKEPFFQCFLLTQWLKTGIFQLSKGHKTLKQGANNVYATNSNGKH
jgi:hypothetical protein